LGYFWIGNAAKPPAWPGAGPDGNPSAPRHAPRVPVYGECSPPLTYRAIISPKPLHRAMSDKIRSYAELRELIRVSLRAQHPEWIEPNGDSPICDSYEARFAELLGLTRSREDAKTFI